MTVQTFQLMVAAMAAVATVTKSVAEAVAAMVSSAKSKKEAWPVIRIWAVPIAVVPTVSCVAMTMPMTAAYLLHRSFKL